MRRAKIVWTAHNLLPHDRAAIPWLDVLPVDCDFFSARIMVHGALAAQCVTARFQLLQTRFA